MSSESKTNVLAIISLTCGLISIPAIICCYGFPFNIVGLVTGGLAIMQINADPDHLSGKGLAIAGILTSLVGILLLILVMTLWAGVMGTALFSSI
jgi:hypothetical protein